MDEKYIEDSIAESINAIIDFCFEHKECGSCPLYDSVKTCKLCPVPSDWSKPERQGDHYIIK